jgi:WD40 repeat protein
MANRDWDQSGIVACMASIDSGRRFFVGGTKLSVWSLDSTLAEPDRILVDLINENDRWITCMAAAPDGSWLAAGDSQGSLTVWSSTDFESLATKDIYTNDVQLLAVSPDSSKIATVSFGQEISVWNAQSLELIKQFEVTDRGLGCIEFVTSDVIVVSGEQTTTWDCNRGEMLQELPASRYNRVLRRSHDNRWLAFTSEDGLNLWNIEQSASERVLRGLNGTDYLLNFSADQKYLLVVVPAAIQIRDVESGQCLQVIDVVGQTVRGIAWFSDSNALIVASDGGGLRTWAPESTAHTHGWKVLDLPVSQPDGSAPVPATAIQMQAAIDLRSFPQLPDSRLTLQSDSNMLAYDAPVKLEEARLFIRYSLAQAGWKEVPADPTTPDYFYFRKDGFKIFVSLYAPTAESTQVSLSLLGNVDLDAIPKTDVGPVTSTFENEATTLYKVQADLLSIETDLLKKLHTAGWTGYSRLNSSHGETSDHRDMEFLQNSTVLRVSIQPSLDEPGVYHVQYGLQSTRFILPVPEDAGFIEFEGHIEPQLVAWTEMSLSQASEFYDARMSEYGFSPVKRGRIIKEEFCWLPYTRGQQDVRIGLQKHATGKTLVRVGEQLESASWQLAAPQTESAEAPSSAGIQAADMPSLLPTVEPIYDVDQKSIHFVLENTPLSQVTESVVASFDKLGFRVNSPGIREEDYSFLTFEKEGVSIDYRATHRNGSADVNIQGVGVLWTKPLPVKKQLISFETWLRRNRLPASLSLLDRYIGEMKSIDL